MAYPWELSFTLRHLLYVTRQPVMKDNLSKEQVFPWPPENPHKKWMSHQQHNLMKPNRRPARSVRGSGTNSSPILSSVSQSPTAFSFPLRCFPSFRPLSLKQSSPALHSNSLTHITAWLRSHTPSPARPADRHPHSHTSLLTGLLSLPLAHSFL